MNKMKYIIVVDMQNDFVTGSLGSEAAQTAAKNIEKYLTEYANSDIADTAVIFTKDTHYNNTYSDTVEGKKLPVEHCVFGTEGWKVVEFLDNAVSSDDFYRPSIEPYSYGGYVYKETFGSLDLVNLLYHLDDVGHTVEEISLVGVCTDICVVSNCLLLKAAFPNVPISVVADCCAGTSPEAHEAALTVMKSCHIDIV
jgi:nicotinamidase-related amidase